MCAEKSGHRFRGRAEQRGMTISIDLPMHLSRALKAPRDAAHSVRVVIGGDEFEADLECRDDGLHRLYIPPHVWKDLHAEIGDLIVGRISNREPKARE